MLGCFIKLVNKFEVFHAEAHQVEWWLVQIEGNNQGAVKPVLAKQLQGRRVIIFGKSLGVRFHVQDV